MPNLSSPRDIQEFSDADFRIVAKADQSKKLAYDISRLTTATTRTVTPPDVSGVIGLDEAGITTVASGGTTNIGASVTRDVSISGTTTITAFDTVSAGTYRQGVFQGALTLTYNATSLILPGGANITTAAGDTFGAISLGSGNWRVLWYQKANGVAVVAVTGGMTLLGTLTTTSGTTQSLTGIAAGYLQLYCECEGVSFSGSGALTLALSSTNGAAYGTAQTIGASTGSGVNSVTTIVTIYNVSSAAQEQMAIGINSAAGNPPAVGAGTTLPVYLKTNTAAVVNAIRFAGGTFDAGTIRIYGVK